MKVGSLLWLVHYKLLLSWRALYKGTVTWVWLGILLAIFVGLPMLVVATYGNIAGGDFSITTIAISEEVSEVLFWLGCGLTFLLLFLFFSASIVASYRLLSAERDLENSFFPLRLTAKSLLLVNCSVSLSNCISAQ